MKNPVKIILILILIIILALGFLIYRSPDEAHWLEENPQRAIDTGRMYAYYLLISDKQELLRMSVGPAKTKIEKSNFREIPMIVMYEQLKEKKLEKELPLRILAPLFSEQQYKEMELIALQKFESFIVMTFAYKGWWGDIVQIPNKGKMLFSVALRYYYKPYRPIGNRLVAKLVRKIANLPLVRDFTGGRWMVFDYNYKYNLNDYFNWVLKEGKNYRREQLKELEKFIEYIENEEAFEELRKKLEESATEKLKFLYGWGNIAVEKQIERIEKFYKTLEEVGKRDELKKKWKKE